MDGQYRAFSIRQFFTDAADGYRLVCRECSAMLGPKDKPRSTTGNEPDDADREVSIAYGIGLYSKLCSTLGLFVAYFVLDIKPGLYPSKRFVLLGYAGVLISVAFVVYFGQFIGWRICDLMFKDIVNNFRSVTSFLVMCCMVAYLTHGLFSTAWLVEQRIFVHEFLSNSFIKTPKSYQRRHVVRAFLISMTITSITEPLYITSSCVTHITQANGFYTDFDAHLFPLFKCWLVVTYFLSALLVGMASNFVPILTSFLISNTAKYIKSELGRQLGRVNACGTTGAHNPHLLSRLNDYERRFINDFACGSITMDWPSIEHNKCPGNVSPEYCRSEHSSSVTSSISSGVACPPTKGNPKPRPTGTLLQVRPALGPDGLLFAYKNLIKSLNRVKDAARSYESKFGYIHLAQIYLNGLITAQWVVFGLLQIRSTPTGIRDTSDINLAWSDFYRGLVFRAVSSVFTFVAANTIMFVRTDRLPQQLAKLRSQLFRLNIELARSAIEHHRSRSCPPKGDRWRELEQLWTLYDQAARLSLKARVRLGSSMVYEKSRLIQIFLSEVSAVLVVVQAIDLYKLS